MNQPTIGQSLRLNTQIPPQPSITAEDEAKYVDKIQLLFVQAIDMIMILNRNLGDIKTKAVDLNIDESKIASLTKFTNIAGILPAAGLLVMKNTIKYLWSWFTFCRAIQKNSATPTLILTGFTTLALVFKIAAVPFMSAVFWGLSGTLAVTLVAIFLAKIFIELTKIFIFQLSFQILNNSWEKVNFVLDIVKNFGTAIGFMASSISYILDKSPENQKIVTDLNKASEDLNSRLSDLEKNLEDLRENEELKTLMNLYKMQYPDESQYSDDAFSNRFSEIFRSLENEVNKMGKNDPDQSENQDS